MSQIRIFNRELINAVILLANCNMTLTSYDASGVSILEDGSDGITMELEMQWDGNPNIVLDIKTYLGVGLPVQVSCLHFSVLRILFGHCCWNKPSSVTDDLKAKPSGFSESEVNVVTGYRDYGLNQPLLLGVQTVHELSIYNRDFPYLLMSISIALS